MRKEVKIYISVFALVFLALAILYFFNLQFTGFAIFQESSQADFDQGNYSNTFYNGSALVLNSSSGSLNGIYISRIFDAGENSSWLNLSWQGEIPENTSLVFSVKACSLQNCSDVSFQDVGNNKTINLSPLNLNSRYFQYKISFSGYNLTSNETNTSQILTPFVSSVSINYKAIQQQQQQSQTLLTIIEPKGEKTTTTGIPITYNVQGVNLTCWYNVIDSSNNFVIQNTTLSNCANSTFDLSSDGSYIINLYANGTSGFNYTSSSFSVQTQQQTTNQTSESQQTTNETTETINETTNETTQTPNEITNEIQQQTTEQQQVQEQPTIIQLSVADLPTLTLNPGSSQNLALNIQNTGNVALSSCKLSIQEEFSSWFNISPEEKNLNPGESSSLTLVLSLPQNLTDGERKISINVNCGETSSTKELTVNVVNKKLDIDIIDVQRTRSDRIRVLYSLKELAGQDQNVEIKFLILDQNNQQVSNITENKTIDANSEKEFRTNMQINETIEGNLTLQASLNSQIYSVFVQEPITLGAPTGFAIFEGFGTGGFVLLLGVVSVLIVVLLIVRRIRNLKKNQ
ncbi:MAG: hypothetical protein KatS3mg001_240 [Candidatus Pacearchaeota archaeon]|nr:MAG: hypothetical protein KatS3mg001_240 [Candidatus Pacearchaeota archaeon]